LARRGLTERRRVREGKRFEAELERLGLQWHRKQRPDDEIEVP
jgi:hypothetical protein